MSENEGEREKEIERGKDVRSTALPSRVDHYFSSLSITSMHTDAK